jgi:hypothetical protein
MATQLSQDPTTEPDRTQADKLRAAARHLEQAADGTVSLDLGVWCAMVLCGAVLVHEAQR